MTHARHFFKDGFKFSKKELTDFLVTVFFLGLIVGFNDGKDSFVFSSWALNLFNSILMVFVVLLIHLGFQKFFAYMWGYRAEFKIFPIGLIIGVLVTLLSNGNLWVLIPAGITVSHVVGERLGMFRYGFNYAQQGIIASMGSAGNIFFALFVKFLDILFNIPTANTIISISLLLALFTMLPIPPLNGSHMIFGSLKGYIVLFISMIIASLFIYFSSFLIALISIIVLTLFGSIYFVYLESK